MDGDLRRHAGQILRTEYMRRGLNTAQAASVANVDARTFAKIVSGAARPESVRKAFDGFGLPWPPAEDVTLAAGYSGPEVVSAYAGTFELIRRDLVEPSQLRYSHGVMAWDARTRCYRSTERHAADVFHHSSVHRSEDMQVLHLLTSFRGALRLISLEPIRGAFAPGHMLSQSEVTLGGVGGVCTFSAPVVYRRVSADPIDPETLETPRSAEPNTERELQLMKRIEDIERRDLSRVVRK